MDDDNDDKFALVASKLAQIKSEMMQRLNEDLFRDIAGFYKPIPRPWHRRWRGDIYWYCRHVWTALRGRWPDSYDDY